MQVISPLMPWRQDPLLGCYSDSICCSDRLIRLFLVHQNNSPWCHSFWCPEGRASAGMVLTLCMSRKKWYVELTHWGWVICISKLTIVGSGKGLLPGWCQAIIWTSAAILLIEPLGTNVIEILIEIHTFPIMKMHLKISSISSRP